MKHTPQHRIAIIATIALSATSAHSASIVAGDSISGGIGYEWTASMAANESVTTVGLGDAAVGVWSWQKDGSPNVGWTHTSDWMALTLTEDTTLTIVMGRNSSLPDPGNVGSFRPTDNLFPSFTIWSGWDNTSTESHEYNNGAGSSSLAWTGGLSNIVGFVDNSTQDTAELTLTLAAGQYTIAFGGKGPATGGLPQQGYYATLVTVPEPSAPLLALGAAGLMAFRRRR